MKSPKPRNKAQRKVDYKYYDAITMRRNYEEKLWGEIMFENYQLVYYDAENVGIIGILAYPKSTSKKKDSEVIQSETVIWIFKLNLRIFILYRKKGI